MDGMEREITLWEKGCIWLKTTLFILGIGFVTQIAYILWYGIPGCAKTLDAQVMEDKLNHLTDDFHQSQDTVVMLLNRQQEEDARMEKRLAKK